MYAASMDILHDVTARVRSSRSQHNGRAGASAPGSCIRGRAPRRTAACRRSLLEAGEGSRLDPGRRESALDAAGQAVPLQSTQLGEARQLGQQRAQHRGRRLAWLGLPAAARLPVQQQAGRRAIGPVDDFIVAGIDVPHRAALREGRHGRGVQASSHQGGHGRAAGKGASRASTARHECTSMHAQLGHAALLANHVVPCAGVVRQHPAASDSGGTAPQGLPKLEQDGGCIRGAGAGQGQGGVAADSRPSAPGRGAPARAARRTIAGMRLLGWQAACGPAQERQEHKGQGACAARHRAAAAAPVAPAVGGEGGGAGASRPAAPPCCCNCTDAQALLEALRRAHRLGGRVQQWEQRRTGSWPWRQPPIGPETVRMSDRGRVCLQLAPQ